MKVTGFSFIKNAIKFDYPIVEAITSILPVCDDFILAVGASDDETIQLIEQIDTDKITIVHTEWDDSLRKDGEVLADETNKALAQIPEDSDWAFYIQGDEVVHEKYLPEIKASMEKYLDDKSVDGLLFKYLHFYGSYDYVGASSKWYTDEIRIIRNDRSIYSYRDAQGFRKGDNQKLVVYPIDAYVYHYGWAREPKAMQQKNANQRLIYTGEEPEESSVIAVEEFDYSSTVGEIKAFEGDHPAVMQRRIAQKNWKFDQDISRNRKTLKDKTKRFLKDYMGIDSYYRNYILKEPPKK